MPFIFVLSLIGAVFLFMPQLDRGQERPFPGSAVGRARYAVGTTRRRAGGGAQGNVSAPLLQKLVAIASLCKIVKHNLSVAGEAPASETYQACKDETSN